MVIISLMLLITLFSTTVNAQIKLSVNNKEIDFKGDEPTLINDRTYVPVRFLAEALGAELNAGSFDSTDIIRQTKLKEELKRYIEEKELEDMEYIAESQKNLEMLVDAGHKKIYLYGDEFTILKQMENVECIGINAPIISVQAESREEFRNQNIKLKGVKFVNTETKKIAMDEPIIDEYYTVLDVLTSYIGKVKKEMGGSRHGKDYI